MLENSVLPLKFQQPHLKENANLSSSVIPYQLLINGRLRSTFFF